MTGEVPFAELRSEKSVLDHAKKGKRPRRPKKYLVHRGLDDRLWNLISQCWNHDPLARPSASSVLAELQRQRALPALDVPDLSGLVVLENENINTIHAAGGFGDVRRGVLNMAHVALKTLVFKSHDQPVLRLTKVLFRFSRGFDQNKYLAHSQRFRREASIWNKLHHTNILPFLGIAEVTGLATCLISPWMQNGNCLAYLGSRPPFDCRPMVSCIIRVQD